MLRSARRPSAASAARISGHYRVGETVLTGYGFPLAIVLLIADKEYYSQYPQQFDRRITDDTHSQYQQTVRATFRNVWAHDVVSDQPYLKPLILSWTAFL